MKPDLNVDRLLRAMEDGLRRYLPLDPVMIGIHTGGAWIARTLHSALQIEAPLGTLDISFYRDDFTRIGLNPQVKASHLPVDVNERHVLLVDDVLHTGRTTRAAMNVIFDYGRPRSIVLAVLVDRNGRELPVQPDVVGISLQLESRQHVKLSGPDDLSLNITERPT
jgi:pyrimidine operon attenuation protein/uracil phosphoribosyltransferase